MSQRDLTAFKRRQAAVQKLQVELSALALAYDADRRAQLSRLDIEEIWPDDLADEVNPYDVLDQIYATPGGHWIWLGKRNKKGTPVVSFHRQPLAATLTPTALSAALIVHRLVTGEHHQKAYHPRCGEQACVRPEHRCRTCFAS